MNKIKTFNYAYTIPTIVFILTILSTSLSITFLVTSYYIKKTNKRIKVVSDWKKYFKVLDEVLETFETQTNIGEKITSPYDGWFSELPEEFENFKISYIVEDSKIDINHLDASIMKKMNVFVKDVTLPDNFYKEDFENLIKNNKNDENKNAFSIYMVPNLNTADSEKVKKFLISWNFSTRT